MRFVDEFRDADLGRALAGEILARIERLRHGDTDRNGVGSTRKLSFAGMLPFMGIQIIALILLYTFPQIGLWLPSVLYAR